MQVNRFHPLLNVASRAIVSNCNKISIRSHYKKPFSYEDNYKGLFDYLDHKRYPKKLGSYKEEELLDEVHEIKNRVIDSPSPFHIVKRIRGDAGSIKSWQLWVTLRRLNLHSTRPGDVAIVPNTPQFNALIAKVKHLLKVTPVVLPDGKFPTAEDIGALKICQYTGNVIIDEKLRLQENRLYEKPLLWQGNHLRSKLRKLTGIHSRHHLN